MRSNPLEKAVRRIGLAASVAGAALLALSSPWALAAAPDAAQKKGLQPQFQLQQQHQAPRQQNNRVNEMQPQLNLKAQPQPKQQLQQQQFKQSNQPKPAYPPCPPLLRGGNGAVSNVRSIGQPRSIQRTSVSRSSSLSGFTLPLLTASGGGIAFPRKLMAGFFSTAGWSLLSPSVRLPNTFQMSGLHRDCILAT